MDYNESDRRIAYQMSGRINMLGYNQVGITAEIYKDSDIIDRKVEIKVGDQVVVLFKRQADILAKYILNH